MKNRLYLSVLVAILLCVVGWSVRAELQRSGPARQAWEYKSLVLIIQGAGSTTMYEDAKMVPGTPVTRMPELGAQGWELVAIAADNSTTAFWLKRPK
jgi:uncharacterized membrane protein